MKKMITLSDNNEKIKLLDNTLLMEIRNRIQVIKYLSIF